MTLLLFAFFCWCAGVLTLGLVVVYLGQIHDWRGHAFAALVAYAGAAAMFYTGAV